MQLTELQGKRNAYTEGNSRQCKNTHQTKTSTHYNAHIPGFSFLFTIKFSSMRNRVTEKVRLSHIFPLLIKKKKKQSNIQNNSKQIRKPIPFAVNTEHFISTNSPLLHKELSPTNYPKPCEQYRMNKINENLNPPQISCLQTVVK